LHNQLEGEISKNIKYFLPSERLLMQPSELIA